MIVTKLDLCELAVRMCEANYQIARPSHMDAEDALVAMDAAVREGWLRSARVALEYIKECLDEGGPIEVVNLQ